MHVIIVNHFDKPYTHLHWEWRSKENKGGYAIASVAKYIKWTVKTKIKFCFCCCSSSLACARPLFGKWVTINQI